MHFDDNLTVKKVSFFNGKIAQFPLKLVLHRQKIHFCQRHDAK